MYIVSVKYKQIKVNVIFLFFAVLWNVYGECENYHVINSAHSGAILQLTYNEDGNHFYTASTDKTVGVFDSHTAQRIKRLKGHTLYVNSCHPARRGAPLIVSGW